MIYTFFAAFLIGIADGCSKYAISKLKTGRLMFISGTTQILLTFIFFKIMNGKLPEVLTIFKLSFIQILSTIAYLSYVIALYYGNVSIITAIISSSSIFTFLLGTLVLKEKISFFQFLGIILVIVGSIGISYEKKSNTQNNKKILWLTLTVIATILWGIWAFLIKIMVSHIKPFELSFFNSTFSFVFLLPYMFFSIKTEKNVRIDIFSVFVSILFAVFVFTGLVSFYYSASRIPVSIAFPIFCSSPLVTAIFSAIFFKEKLQLHQYFSLFIIIFSLFLINLT
ncbi:MAG: DMT family transporter [candidate division WOR-3 bacterium]